MIETNNDVHQEISQTNIRDEDSTVDNAISQMEEKITKFIKEIIAKVKDLIPPVKNNKIDFMIDSEGIDKWKEGMTVVIGDSMLAQME